MTDLTAAHLALAESSWEELCKLKYMGAVTKDEFVAMQRELIAKVCMLGFGEVPKTIKVSDIRVLAEAVLGKPGHVSIPISTGLNFIGFDPATGEAETAYISADLSDVVKRLSMVHERDVASKLAVEGCHRSRCSDKRAGGKLAAGGGH